MGKYTESFRLAAVAEYLKGDWGFRRVAARHGVDVSLLRRWVASYRASTHLSKRHTGYGYTNEFKHEVLRYMAEHRLSLRQTAAHFGLGQSSQIGDWQRSHYSSGSSYMTEPCQRRAASMSKRIKPQQPTHDDDASKPRDQLLAELEYMRMENAVLKELQALREEKERQRKKKS